LKIESKKKFKDLKILKSKLISRELKSRLGFVEKYSRFSSKAS
jgi:hypothetical protein